MEFDKSRVYTALNADELRAGDKVIVAYNLYGLKEQVKMFTESAIDVIEVIQDEDYFNRFKVKHSESFPLAYLVERAENCTNCGAIYTCAFQVREHPELEKCKNWKPKTKQKAEKAPAWFVKGLLDGSIERTSDEAKPKTEQKAEKHTNYNHCEEARKAYENVMAKAEKACKVCELSIQEADDLICTKDGRKIFQPTSCCGDFREKEHYRPFKDTDELIKVFCEKTPKIYDKDDEKLFMPYIWVRNKENKRVWLITEFDNRLLDYLFTNCEFLDGSPCGVEE